MLSKRFAIFSALVTLAAAVFCLHRDSLNSSEYRKKIYNDYVSSHKYDSEWKDPHNTLGNSKFNDFNVKSVLERDIDISINKSYVWGNYLLLIVIFFSLCLLLCHPKTIIFFLIFFLTLFWHWKKLYQEKIAEKHYLSENLRHENECRRSELSWYESLYLYFGSYVSDQTDCEKYYKAILVDPFWEVSIPIVIANAITSIICEPLKVIAATLRTCGRELFSGLTLLQLLMVFLAFLFFSLIWKKYSLSLCWGLISFQPTLYSSGNACVPKSTSYLQLLKNSILGILFGNNQLIHNDNQNYLKHDVVTSHEDGPKKQEKNILSNDHEQDKERVIACNNFKRGNVHNLELCSNALKVNKKFQHILKDSLSDNFCTNKNMPVSKNMSVWKTSSKNMDDLTKLNQLKKINDKKSKIINYKLSQVFGASKFISSPQCSFNKSQNHPQSHVA
ncbi:uncharacterized protein TNIN_480011 [Trichonephila inaurata madagascariensis]|uniref:Chloride channel CLIC-like protein 1 n=1 Tax=Trichonephila inaurata madagascariensis TaxID=2747483 RepID=A0A8X6YBB5_9ARAC|nr:uncharacterized protein TNIN_480011 [Trichonephila inaurata madagascariensis]